MVGYVCHPIVSQGQEEETVALGLEIEGPQRGDLGAWSCSPDGHQPQAQPAVPVCPRSEVSLGPLGRSPKPRVVFFV